MNEKLINNAFSGLLGSVSKKDAKWLRKLLSSSDAASIFSTLDGELFSLDEGVPSTVMINSTVRGEGRTSLAIMLAVFSAIQNSQRRILLVDADLGDDCLSDIFKLDGKLGMFDFFNGKTDLSEHTHVTALPNLWITPLGSGINGVSLLPPQEFKRFMELAASEFDLVIIDGPAASTSKSVPTMAQIVQNCVLVVRYGGPTREQISALKSELDRVGSNVLGCVLNQREFVVPGFLYGSR